MNNEIKEILDRLFVYKNENDEMKYQPEDILTIDDVWLLLDYITNLQEENKNLKNEQISKYQTLKELQEENDKLKEDKSKMFETAVKRNNQLLDRIYNAIEYLDIDEEILETCEIYDVNGIEVYKILKGENNE